MTAASTLPASAYLSAPGLRDGGEVAPGGAVGSSLSTASQAQFGEQLSRLHAMVETLSRQGRIDHLLPDLPGELVPTYAQLIEADVPEVLARRLVRHVADSLEPDQLGDPRSIREALCEAVEPCIPIAPPIRAVAGTRRVVALVGPTGVGKTTTVAKLAANFKLAQGLRVGLVTVDTYRIAAVEQLKTYAEIIDLPAGRRQRSGRDDAGRSTSWARSTWSSSTPRAGARATRSRSASWPSSWPRPGPTRSTWSSARWRGERSLRSAVERFAQVQADRLILTKLDEADGLGGDPRRAGAGQPTGQLPDHRPGRPRRHRAGRSRIGWLASSSGWRPSCEDILPGRGEQGMVTVRSGKKGA